MGDVEDDVDVYCNGYDLRYVTKFDYYVGSPYFDDSKGLAVLKYDNKILLHGKYSMDYNKSHAVVVDDLILKSKQRAIKNHVTNLMYSKNELIDPLIDNLYALYQRSRPFDIVGSERREIINDLTSRFEVTKPNKEFIITPKPVKRKSLIVNRYKTVRLLHKIDEYVS